MINSMNKRDDGYDDDDDDDDDDSDGESLKSWAQIGMNKSTRKMYHLHPYK